MATIGECMPVVRDRSRGGRRPRRPSSTPISWSSAPDDPLVAGVVDAVTGARAPRVRPERGRGAARRLEGVDEGRARRGRRPDRRATRRSARARRPTRVRVPRDVARALRREDRRARGGQGRGRHRVDRRGARRGARVPLGRRVRRRRPHVRDRGGPHRARGLAVRAVRRPAAQVLARRAGSQARVRRRPRPEHRRHGRVLAGARSSAPTSSTR